MLEQAEDFRAESRGLHALLAGTSDAQMAQETQFKGWTIDTVIQHLHFFNLAAEMALVDEPALLALFADLKAAREAGETTIAYTDRYLEGLKGQALLEAWIETCEKVADLFAPADPKARLKWAGPDMSARSFITARLMETWAHGQEVYDILGAERTEHDYIRNIAMLGVNTFGWTFVNRKEPVPKAKPYIRLTAPSGEIWEWNEPSDAERIEGPAVAFCQVVAQTRNIADVDLSVTGPVAREWMAKAQCFAGPPNDPPAPGTRFRVS